MFCSFFILLSLKQRGTNLNLHQKLVVVITDILLIAEVCVSMYFAGKSSPEMLTGVFIKTFFIMCIPTLVIAKLSIKRLGSFSASGESDIKP